MYRRLGPLTLLVALLLLLAGCGEDDRSEPGPAEIADGGTPGAREFTFPDAPQVPDGPVEPTALDAAGRVIEASIEGSLDEEALGQLAASGDPRLGWLISDLMRFAPSPDAQLTLAGSFSELTGADAARDPEFPASPWRSVTDHLIAWDLPAFAGYLDLKEQLFTATEPGWEPFFTDAGEIDYRLLSWGGVLIDDRPLGDPESCERGCIPALDDPGLTDAAGGDWYPDNRFVFGVEIGGEAVAFPRNIMEVHEMVNITIGGRRLAIPYCTLCGSAQAYFTDRDLVGGEPLVMRTSGLLSRSNKVMYELGTRSVFDTFSGEALTGPLLRRGVELEQAPVVTSSWGDWKREHPGTKIVAEDSGLDRSYPLDPLRGRDDNGPIFPVGDVDPRLPVQEQVVGVIAPDGSAVAFPARLAREQLQAGEPVELAGVRLVREAGGLRAESADGEPLASHQAFWFAWSQFNPETALYLDP